MKFKGTIIITDPCYVVKELEERLKESGVTVEYPRFNGGDIRAYERAMRKFREQVDPYDDWKQCAYGSNMEKLGFTSYISEPTIYGDWSCQTWETSRNDIETQIDELNSLCNRAFSAIKQYGVDSVQNEVYSRKFMEYLDELNKLGGFCADAGMVAVFLLDEVLKYNPDFSKWIEEHPGCVTVIHDFDGDVQYYVDKDNGAHIIGRGNINFFTSQTGL